MIRLLTLAAALQGKLLFQDLPAQKVCQNGLSWAREFAVAKACSETVRIESIRGVTRQSKGEARLWLDGTLLGPLRAEFNESGWQSPVPVALTAGKHSISIECGAESFEIEGVSIGGEARRRRERAPAQAAALAPPAESFAVSSGLARQAPSGCGALRVNAEWLPGKPEKSIMLSVVSGAAVRTPRLALLRRGEKLRWWFYVHPRLVRDALKSRPILLECLREADGSWVLAFGLDHEAMNRAGGQKKADSESQPLGYREDKWTPLDLEFCADGRLRLSLNEGELRGAFSVTGEAMPLLIQSREIEFEVKAKK